MNITMKTASRIKSGSLGKKILLLCSLLLIGLFFSTCAEAAVSPEPTPGDIVDPGLGEGLATDFVSKWVVPSGGSVQLPMVDGGDYDYVVDWGDGSPPQTIKDPNSPLATHVYPQANEDKEYVVTIRGVFNGFRFLKDPDAPDPDYGDADKFVDVEQWGNMQLGNTMDSHFMGAKNLEKFTAPDTPDLSGKTSLKNTFRGASKFNGDLSGWDMSGVMDMDNMFRDATAFDQDMNAWKLNGVTSHDAMLMNTAMELTNKVPRKIGVFVTEWQIDNDGDSLTLPLILGGSYDFHVDWGDGTPEEEFNVDTSGTSLTPVTHTYAVADTYTVRITGVFEGWRFVDDPDAPTPDYGDAAKLVDVKKWGMMALGAVDSHFFGASNLVEFTATDTPDLTKTTSLKNTFRGASKFDGDLSAWDLSSVTDMSYMFQDATAFNQDLSQWKVDGVSKYYAVFLRSGTPAAQQPQKFKAFITKWITNAGGGVTLDTQIKLPMIANGNYDFHVDWGDGTGEVVDTTTPPTKTYTTASTYTVSITGIFEGLRFADDPDAPTNFGDAKKLADIMQWGGAALGDTYSHFWDASNLEISASDAPDLTKTTSLKRTFQSATKISNDLNSWDVSGITDMGFMFYGTLSFNGDISNWDVSSVTDMSGMFQSSRAFNKDIKDWDVSSVTFMGNMFRESVFNQPLNDWGDKTKNVMRMGAMFMGSVFNQPIDGWDVSSVTYMDYMFYGSQFNSALDGWGDTTKNVEYTQQMFRDNKVFNQPLSSWNVTSMTAAKAMFRGTSRFNQDIGNWQVDSLIDVREMFASSAFRQDLSSWNLSPNTSYDTYFGLCADDHLVPRINGQPMC